MTGEYPKSSKPESTVMRSLIVLWVNQPHEEQTSALCPSLYPNHSEAMDFTGRGSQINFHRAMIGLIPVGSSFSTASTHVWRAKVCEMPSTPEPELLLQDGKVHSDPFAQSGEGSFASQVPAPHPSHTLPSFQVALDIPFNLVRRVGVGVAGERHHKSVRLISLGPYEWPRLQCFVLLCLLFICLLLVFLLFFVQSCFCPQNVSQDSKHRTVKGKVC